MPPENTSSVLSNRVISGAKVVNQAGENLGTISDLMVDLSDGRVVYAVLSFGGLFGVGDKLYAIPWAVMEYQQDTKRFILNVAKERLAEAPGFKKTEWPDVVDQDWHIAVHQYYGFHPYWETPFHYQG